MTPAEAKEKIVPRLIAKRSDEIAWGDIVSAVNTATPQQRQRMARALSRNRHAVVGKVIARLVNQVVRAEAETQADALLADNSINLTELAELL